MKYWVWTSRGIDCPPLNVQVQAWRNQGGIHLQAKGGWDYLIWIEMSIEAKVENYILSLIEIMTSVGSETTWRGKAGLCSSSQQQLARHQLRNSHSSKYVCGALPMSTSDIWRCRQFRRIFDIFFLSSTSSPRLYFEPFWDKEPCFHAVHQPSTIDEPFPMVEIVYLSCFLPDCSTFRDL